MRGSRGRWGTVRPAAAATLAALAALTAAGCGSGGKGGPFGGGDAPQPALTRQEAEAAVDRYERVTNQARRDGDAEALARAEAGSLLRRSTAEIVKGEEPTEVSYRDRRFYIPAGGERWFLVSATSGDREHLLTFAERDGRWKAVSELTVLPDDEVPDVELSNHGLATAVPGAAAAQVADHVESVWEARGEVPDGALADSPALADLRSSAAREPEDHLVDRAYQRITPEERTVYALRAADGGTLAVVPLGHEMTETSRQEGADLVPTADQAALGARRAPTITSTHLGEAAAHLPEDGGPARLVTYEYEMTDAR